MSNNKFEIPSCDKIGCTNFMRETATCWLDNEPIAKWIESHGELTIHPTCQLVIQIKRYKTRELIRS